MLAGIGRAGARDGSEPSGAGPIAGWGPIGFGSSRGGGILRSRSIRSPFKVPENVTLPTLNETMSPFTLPSSIGVAPSVEPKKLPVADSIVPVKSEPS